jgi:hypothetical protein
MTNSKPSMAWITSKQPAQAGRRSGFGNLGRSPLGTVMEHPIDQGRFKTDIMTGFFAFQPLVSQDFIALGEELLVEGRFLQKGVFLRGFWHRGVGYEKRNSGQYYSAPPFQAQNR